MASLLLSQAQRPIASLTLNGAQCISPIITRLRISRYDCTRMVRTSGLTLSLAPCSRAAINCMFLVCKDLTTPLRRTFAMPARRPQARALTPAREVEHRHLHRRLHQRRLQLQLLQRPDPRQRRGLVRRRLRDPSTDDVILRCPGDAGAVRTPGAYRFVSSNSGVSGAISTLPTGLGAHDQRPPVFRFLLLLARHQNDQST